MKIRFIVGEFFAQMFDSESEFLILQDSYFDFITIIVVRL
jgi:hypothetical protein